MAARTGVVRLIARKRPRVSVVFPLPEAGALIMKLIAGGGVGMPPAEV